MILVAVMRMPIGGQLIRVTEWYQAIVVWVNQKEDPDRMYRSIINQMHSPVKGRSDADCDIDESIRDSV